MEESSYIDLGAFLTTFAIQILIVFVVVFIFSVVLRPNHRALYEPRSKFKQHHKPVPLSKRPSSWIENVIKIKEKDSLKQFGPDKIIFLRFLFFGVKYFSLISIISIFLCIFHFIAPTPPNQHSLNQMKPNTTTSPTLNVLTIENPNFSAEWLIIHSILQWIIAFWGFYNLLVVWDEYALLRKDWFASDEYQNSISNRTLLLTNITPSMQNEASIQRFLQKFHLPYPVKQIVLGRNVEDLPTLIQQHSKLTVKLEKVLTKYLPFQKITKRPIHRDSHGKAVDTISHCSSKILTLEEKIYAIQCKGDANLKTNSTAFVDFENVSAAHSAYATICIKSTFFNKIKVSLCPDVDDIIWDNIGESLTVRRAKSNGVVIFSMGFILGWTILILIVSLITQIDYLARTTFFIGILENSPFLLTAIATLIGPSLLFFLNVVILPKVLRFITSLQGYYSLSEIEIGALVKYFFFLLLHFLISTTFSSFVATLIGKAEDNKVALSEVEKLSNAIVGYLKFATTCILVTNTHLIGLGSELSQAFPLIKSFFYRKMAKLTPREVFELNSPPKFYYIVIYGQTIFALFFGGAYCLVAPIISPFLLIFFSFAYVVMKYQLIYVYETACESGGKHWPMVFNLVILAIFINQSFTTIVLLVSSSVGERIAFTKPAVILSGILPFVTVAFYFYAIKRNELDKNTKTPISLATNDTDIEEKFFNPIVCKPLLKVWVEQRYNARLSLFHQPVYDDLLDYIQKTQSPSDQHQIPISPTKRHFENGVELHPNQPKPVSALKRIISARVRKVEEKESSRHIPTLQRMVEEVDSPHNLYLGGEMVNMEEEVLRMKNEEEQEGSQENL